MWLKTIILSKPVANEGKIPSPIPLLPPHSPLPEKKEETL